jgi:hypothetical protein
MSSVATDGLTRELIRDMRRADGFIAQRRNGTTELRLIMGRWSEREYELKIELEFSADRTGEAFSYIQSAQHHEALRTALASLKPGETVWPDFRPNAGTNGYAKSAGLHVDELYLMVTPKEGSKAPRRYYLVDVSVCPDNTARMTPGVPFSDYL